MSIAVTVRGYKQSPWNAAKRELRLDEELDSIDMNWVAESGKWKVGGSRSGSSTIIFLINGGTCRTSLHRLQSIGHRVEG